MKKIIISLMVLLFNGQVNAAEHAQALSQCLVNNTTEADKTVMTRWVYSSLSNHPSLSSMTSINDATRVGADQEMARLVEKFMYQTCSEQLKNAVKNEGPAAIERSLRSYVEVTGREILQHPSISNSVTGVAKQLDVKKLFEALMSQ